MPRKPHGCDDLRIYRLPPRESRGNETPLEAGDYCLDISQKPLKIQGMIKLMAISDSHGETDMVRDAGRLARARGVTLALHLGDDLEDAAPLMKMGLEVRGVHGVFSPHYLKPEPPNRLLVRVGDALSFLLTHSPLPHQHDRPEDGPPEAVARRMGARVILYGHTHAPDITERDGLLWVNPGHLKREDKRGWPPTIAWLDVEGASLNIEIIEALGGRTLFRWP